MIIANEGKSKSSTWTAEDEAEVFFESYLALLCEEQLQLEIEIAPICTCVAAFLEGENVGLKY